MDTATRMSDSASSEEMAHLRALVPLHALPDDALGELLEKARFESIAKGRMLFEQGDTDHEHVYLLDGSIVLLSDRAVVDKVSAGSDTARFPLAHQLPRKQSARAKTDVRIARIDSRLLSDALARTQTVDYQVSDLGDASEDDWMSMLLQSRVLQQVPASNIQRVMMSVEQVEVASGDDLIRQGDPGDYYYMLTKGRAVVRRDAADGKGPCELATLGPGDAFGEEALLSDSPRNSTVSMLQDGEVLRLSKEDFLDLIHNPLLDRIDMQAAQAKVDQGAIWLDLRSSEQYDESHLPGAINFPFESLRYQAASLAPDGHYVLYSNTGGRAMAGAFLLIERGIDVSVLEGGIRDGETGSTAAAPTQSAAAAPSVPDDHLAHARIREAEQRAEELEERLKAVERVKQDAEEERQQHLQQVRAAVDQARRKLVETEEQKREALAAQEKAYADMERLTSSLEQAESERASLQGRMAEIEGLDKQLQTRLAKAERELIGERERAESATSSLEDLSARLSEILEQREEERDQHARERGELKEEMTALQMDLELAQADMQELQQSLNARKASEDTDNAALDELRQRLEAAEAASEALSSARDEAQAGLEALTTERDSLAQKMAQLEAQAATDLGHAEERAVKLDAALQEAENRASETMDALQLELQRLRDEHAELNTKISAQEEQAQQRVTELESRLTAMTRDGAEELQAQEKIAADLQVQLSAVREQAERDQETITSSTAELAELQHALEQAKAENDALQSQLVAGSEDAGVALQQAQARITELESRLADEKRLAGERGDALEHELAETTAALQTARAEHDQAQQAQTDAQRRFDELQTTVDQLRADLAASSEGADEALTQARARIEDLETALADEQQATRDSHAQLETSQSETAQLQAQVAELQTRLDDDARLAGRRLEEANDGLAQLQQRFEAAQSESALAEQALHAERDQLRAENAALQQRVAAGDASADEALQEVQARTRQLEAQIDELQRAAVDIAADHDKERLQLRTELSEAAVHAEQALTAAQEQAQAEAAELRDQVQRLAAENATLQAGIAEKASGIDEAEGQLRAEVRELSQRLEEREIALAAAREEQSELIEALNAASIELETLQLAVSDKDEEQARLVDLENQVAEALRTHEQELLEHEQVQKALREQLEQHGEQSQTLEKEVARLQALVDAGATEDQQDLQQQRDALRAELAVREGEVEQLRGVLEEYVDQIRAARSDDDDVSEVTALRSELEMVREQAIRDVAHMREQLAAAETQKRRLQQADGREAISLEAMRQKIEMLESSLTERQRELADAEASRHMLEDSLEDANRQVDEAKREREKALVEADEALFSRREAETARDQLQEALYLLQEDAEQARVTDLRDSRLKPSKKPIGMASVSGPNRWLPGLAGAVVVLLALEAVSLLSGKGELFSMLLGLAGQ